jgi:hypothetical protein
VRHINVEPLEPVTEPRPAGSDTTSLASSACGVTLPAGRGSVFARSYTFHGYAATPNAEGVRYII